MTILERLKATTGGSRELDAAIYNALPSEREWIAYNMDIRPLCLSSEQWRLHDGWFIGRAVDDKYAEELPHYTASIDAALALVERMLPEHCNSSIKTGDNEFAAYIWKRTGGVDDYSVEGCKSRPIAILTALFTALQGKEKQDA